MSFVVVGRRILPDCLARGNGVKCQFSAHAGTIGAIITFNEFLIYPYELRGTYTFIEYKYSSKLIPILHTLPQMYIPIVQTYYLYDIHYHKFKLISYTCTPLLLFCCLTKRTQESRMSSAKG